ncbi:hypothetical protein ACFL0Y_01505 [Patescibacteria group bacterium]
MTKPIKTKLSNLTVKTSRTKNIVFLIFIFIIVNFLTRGPDLYKAIIKPEDQWYSGQVSWFDPWDVSTYQNVINQGQDGHLFYQDYFDSENEFEIPLYSLYIITGRASSSLSLRPIVIFHLLGIVTSLFLILSSWWLASLWFKKQWEKMTCLFILVLGGGLGWYFLPETALPDIATPNFTFLRALYFPHEAVSLGLLMVTLGYCFVAMTKQKKISIVKAGLANLLMLFFHPYNLIPIAAILTTFCLWEYFRNKSIKFLTNQIPLVISLGLGVGFYLLTIGKKLLLSPTFTGQLSQSFSSPKFSYLILGSGLLIPLAILPALYRKIDQKTRFMLTWLFIQLAVIYLPFNFQRLLIRGLWVPISLLAIRGIKTIFPKTTKTFFVVGLTIVSLSGLSSLFVFTQRVSKDYDNRWVYLNKSEGEIIQYLKEQDQTDKAIMAAPEMANFLTAHTGKKTWLSHKQHLHYQERYSKIAQFYQGKMDQDEVLDFFQKTKTQWIYWGPDEKTIAQSDQMPYQDLFVPVIETKIANLYHYQN